jgi:hypothetical protein
MKLGRIMSVSSKKDLKEAAGFYFCWLLVAFLVMTLFGLILEAATPEMPNEQRRHIGVYIGIAFAAGMAYLTLRSRGLHVKAPMILVGICAPLLTFMGGLILGLIPISYLTTRSGQ